MYLGGGGNSPLTPVSGTGTKLTVRKNVWSDTGIAISGTKVAMLIGALEAWCLYAVNSDNTLTLLATGGQTAYYSLRAGANGNYETFAGTGSASSSTPYFVVLE